MRWMAVAETLYKSYKNRIWFHLNGNYYSFEKNVCVLLVPVSLSVFILPLSIFQSGVSLFSINACSPSCWCCYVFSSHIFHRHLIPLLANVSIDYTMKGGSHSLIFFHLTPLHWTTLSWWEDDRFIMFCISAHFHFLSLLWEHGMNLKCSSF